MTREIIKYGAPRDTHAGDTRTEIDIKCHVSRVFRMAKVLISAEARLQHETLPKSIKARVQAIFLRLENWPAVSGAKPLRHGLAGRYRIRTGGYRIQFRVVGDEVIVEKIGNRGGFYD
jgi:mRNA-degrading endonuclease RelE of RelBE toxin-antitoxin system